MPRGPFRFLHASDLHLEQPLHGFAAAPDHLKRLCIDAPYLAAQRVFDAALKEDVAFVLLAGDIVNLTTAGARAVSFLHEQFERLAQRKILVYWAGGDCDSPEHWPNSLHWPENVTAFPGGRVQEVLIEREGKPLAHVLGLSRYTHQELRAREFHSTYPDSFAFALAHGNVAVDTLAPQNINYWALGGRHNHEPLGEAPLAAHYSGSPQGRSPAEEGPHGCILGHVDSERHVRTQLLPVDEVRWHNELLLIDEETSPVELEHLLRERTRKLLAESGGRTLFVNWKLTGGAALAPAFRRGQLPEKLLHTLQQEFGSTQPAAWTFAIDHEPGTELPFAWYEEDTILGDFLRTLRTFETGDAELDLPSYLLEHEQTGLFKDLLQLADPAEREQVFRQAGLLGAQLLRAEEDVLPLPSRGGMGV